MAKYIPSGDQDFKVLANVIAKQVCADPARYFVTQKDADTLRDAVAAFTEALQETVSPRGRNPVTTFRKESARGDAERIIRKLITMIRANDQIELSAKTAINLYPRNGRPKRQLCPQEPPRLSFVQALHRANAGSPTHELRFSSLDGKPKAEGATRLELFVDLIAPDEPIPTHPGDNHGGRPWYLRSYTRSPIRIVPPMAKLAMRVVYWARWADSTGNVGPFSKSAVGWVEGGNISQRTQRIGHMGHDRAMDDQRPIQVEAPTQVGRRTDYTLELIEVYTQSLMTPGQRSLPAPEADAA